jgi:hypothetical protein
VINLLVHDFGIKQDSSCKPNSGCLGAGSVMIPILVSGAVDKCDSGLQAGINISFYLFTF